MPQPARQTVLIVRAGSRSCALPISAVVETLRPLPVSPIAGAPPFVQGVAMVRGEPAAVIDLAGFLGDAPAAGAAARWVTVRTGDRPAALAVSGVDGVAQLDAADAGRLPLLADACGGALEALRGRDDELLLVLRTARLMPGEVRAALQSWEADA